jgi:hypothetical protein
MMAMFGKKKIRFRITGSQCPLRGLIRAAKE